MSMNSFDSLICIDYSAAATPRLGKDSIWVAGTLLGDDIVINFPTRDTLHIWLSQCLWRHVECGKRLLAGFDFALGYPRGFARALGLNGTPWHATWAYLGAHIQDKPNNANNRFDVAAALNRQLGSRAVFWGRPAHFNLPDLPPKKNVTYNQGLAEWRAFEQQGRTQNKQNKPNKTKIKSSPIGSMQPGWKLAYAGSVGSQSLMGIARLQKHRDEFGDRLAIWPFEGADRPLVFAEIYPSMFDFSNINHPVKDACQVISAAQHIARADLENWLNLDQFSDEPEILNEEGWLLSWPVTP